jgi:hydroxymethylbilane synthase
MPDGLTLGAMPRRADPRDALIVRSDLPAAFVSLPVGARVGTSSLRRHVQISEARPDLVVEELRGNLDTRLRKLDEGQYDAIVLACAGLERLGWQERITERLSPETSVPAPGQGALALEIRAGDTETRSLLLPLHDPATADAVTAERAFQAALQAGCTVPAGAFARVEDETLHLTAMLATDDGSRVVREVERGTRRDAAQIGQRAAHALLRRLGEQ